MQFLYHEAEAHAGTVGTGDPHVGECSGCDLHPISTSQQPVLHSPQQQMRSNINDLLLTFSTFLLFRNPSFEPMFLFAFQYLKYLKKTDCLSLYVFMPRYLVLFKICLFNAHQIMETQFSSIIKS